MTRAPRSPRIVEQKGPGTLTVRSRTEMCPSGPWLSPFAGLNVRCLHHSAAFPPLTLP